MERRRRETERERDRERERERERDRERERERDRERERRCVDISQVVGGILLLVVNLPPMFTFFPFFPTHTIDTDMCTQVVVAWVSSFTLQSSIGISDLDVATGFINRTNILNPTLYPLSEPAQEPVS